MRALCTPSPPPARRIEATALRAAWRSRRARRPDLRPAETPRSSCSSHGAGKTTFLRLVAGLLLPSPRPGSGRRRCPVREARAWRASSLVMETGPAGIASSRWRACCARAVARGLRGASRPLRSSGDRALCAGGVSQRLIGHSRRASQRLAPPTPRADPPLVIADEPRSGSTRHSGASLDRTGGSRGPAPV